MKRPPGFTRLTGSAGLWPAQKPAFAALAQQSLGNAGGPGDGFDPGVLNLLQAMSAAGGILDAITAAGTAATAAQASADAIKLPDLDAAIAAATAASNAQLTKIGAALGLLAQSPSSPAGLGPAPMPPVLTTGCAGSTGGTTSGGGSAGMVAATAMPIAVTNVANALANAGLILASTASSIALTATIIGAAIGLTLLALQFMGKGCGPACIDAAKTEQIYEASADNLFATYKLGMLSLNTLLAGLAYMIAVGQQHEAAFADKQGDAGSANLTRVIQGVITAAQKWPPPKRVPLNVQTAAQSYIYGGQWYPDSLYAAQQLTNEYLKTVLENPKLG